MALTETENKGEVTREDTVKPLEADVKGRILDFKWWMKKQGYSEKTIMHYGNNIALLARRGANILDPESVKEVIALHCQSEAQRFSAVTAYNVFLRMLGLKWEAPICRLSRRLPFIPTEQEIDALIAGCGKKTSVFLQLLKETGMRMGEANRLEWTDIDAANRTITLNHPEKNSEPRIFKVSSKLIDMINTLPKRSRRIFKNGCSRTSFFMSRKTLARKLQNPRLMRISFHTLRHWKATDLYHKTKDVMLVKNFLGHKAINNTMLYIQLAEAIYKETNDEFTVKATRSPEEIKALLEVGFEYICTSEGLMFFRKRK